MVPMRDIVGEAWRGLGRHRLQTALAVIGLSWGLVSLVVLLSYGRGFHDALERGFRGAFGDGVAVVWPGQTSQQAGGERAGRPVRISVADVAALREVPFVRYVSPEFTHEYAIAVGDRRASYLVRGVWPDYARMRSQLAEVGRFPDADDLRLERRVAFLGSEVARRLFGQQPAVGQRIRIGGLAFDVIGVQREKVQLSSYMRPDRESIFIPYTTFGQLMDTRNVDVFVYQAVNPLQQDEAEREVRSLLGRRHRFRADDTRALSVFGSRESRQLVDGLSQGLMAVLGVIGTLTLAIGGIGVANIMLVSVAERTREIGLRKALGAPRRALLLQFLLEGLATTILGGLAGVLVAWLVVLLISPRPFLSEVIGDATRSADIYLVLSPELVAASAALLVLVGLVSALVPAVRASRLDPIEALRRD